MILGSAPLPGSSSCLLAFLWSSCRSVCHWVNLRNTGPLEEVLALNSALHIFFSDKVPVPHPGKVSDVWILYMSHKLCKEVHSSTTSDVRLCCFITKSIDVIMVVNEPRVVFQTQNSSRSDLWPSHPSRIVSALVLVSPVKRFSVNELVVDERRVADHCWNSRRRR